MSTEDFLHCCEAISIFLSWPTIALAVGVIFFWMIPAKEAMYKRASDRTSIDWLMLGIFVGFLGSVCDNLFWGIAWTFNFLDQPEHWNRWSSIGSIPNIIFRQAAGMFSAYCHLQGFKKHGGAGLNSLHAILFCSASFGVIYITLLILNRLNIL